MVVDGGQASDPNWTFLVFKRACALPMMGCMAIHAFPPAPPMLAILDPMWRARCYLPLRQDWRKIVARLIADDATWVGLVQRRPPGVSALPDRRDIALTRALVRSLRPLDLCLADHLIQAGPRRFSFRDAGLL